jgi:hypothetical protein
MPDSLSALEAERRSILQQISELGDFRAGSITATQGRCGNPRCHCHQPGEAGHGPTLRLTYKARGKTVTESFSGPEAQGKAEREIAEFRKYQQLSRAFIELNEKICRQRPVPEEVERQEQEKNGGSHSAGSGARSRVPAGGDFCRTAQVGKAGLGSRGDGDPRGHALCGGGNAGGTTGQRGEVFPPGSLPLWPCRSISRDASQAVVDRAGASRDRASLLRVCALPARPESARSRTGCGGQQAPTAEAAELLRLEADYFARNAPRLRYPEFRRQDLSVGSGVIEAGCKTVIGSRLKRSGMFWTVRGANAILALRCNRLSGKFEDYGENRKCA